MATTTFVLKEPNSDRPTPIFLILRYKDQRVKISTEEKIHPALWDKTAHKAKATKKFPEHPEFNAKLDSLAVRARNAFRKFENDNSRVPSPDEIRSILVKEYDRESSGGKDLFSFIDKFIDEAQNRVNTKTGKVLADCTINVYRNTYRLLQEFKTKRRKRVDFDTIDLDFYHDFTEYLSKEHGFATNTIGKQIKTVKTFLNDAAERGLNKNFAYKSKRFKVATENTDAVYLSEQEIKDLYALDLSDNLRLDRVRDLFLVGCWTGLRFSDFSNITADNIKGDFIEIVQKKTSAPVVIPIHDIVRKVMTKYSKSYDNSLPPALSNVKMNEYIKELCAMVPSLKKKVSTCITKGGLNIAKTYFKYQLITSHTARRSFATNLYLDGVPSYTIMQITGHKTEKAFLRYLKVTPNESAKILQLHWDKKSKLTVA